MNYAQAFDDSLAQYRKELDGLDAETLNWKPAPEKWSVGECVTHIITSNNEYLSILTPIAEGTYKHIGWHKVPLVPGFIGKMLLRTVQPDRKMKVATMKVFEPAKSEVSTDVVDQLAVSHDALKALLPALEGMPIEKIVMSSPVSKWVIYTVKRALDILVAHEARHLNQAKEVLALRKTNLV